MLHKIKNGGRTSLKEFADTLERENGGQKAVEDQGATKDHALAIFSCKTLRRKELRELVPLSDTTIYELEQKGKFPKRFYLTSRCVVWSLAEVAAWIDERRQARNSASSPEIPHPDFKLRRSRN